uniref:cytosolic carboxypeptidase-like protein 5 isoform X1 n=1 Tax=Ciona intestinalis TaxID=7719 RepID=UPI00089DAD5C|nr:cytosolic carboxypeptidase-like protein 5 isoform X1 [Ciona intestinalis]|eukprot:XP_018672540.1 cytosolic carboxypeptidase-like protein 5 isoform X1 [Ciona intestinalis]
MEFRCGGLLFTSKFDSGNLAKVEKADHSDSDSDSGNGITLYGCTLNPDYEFNIWTKPDCAGTAYENGNRSWFYFGIRGYAPNKLIKLNIVNLNRQGKLYSQGMSPLVKTVPSKPRWERIRDRPTHQVVDGQFMLSFTHRFSENRGGTTYFAFCYPYTYTECQEALEALDQKFSHCVNLKPKEGGDSDIYYHRELACKSIDQRRIDLITITSCKNMLWNREPRIEKLFPDKATPRCHRFHSKRVYFLSSRVHPGETPASFVFNGFLKFILKENDPRAEQLRQRFIFKLIPMLNPDGVYRGHYRTDQKGVNLNRVYLNPDPENHASIFAASSLILFYHHYYKTTNLVESEEKGVTWVKGGDSPVEKGAEERLGLGDYIESFDKLELKVDGHKKDVLGHKHPRMVKETPYRPFTGDLLSVGPRESGVAFYVDLHGHASKRGCFIYGNHIESEDGQVDNLLFPKLVSMNTAHFDFNGCNFTERNMYLKDKRDGMSKEGSGRVAMFKLAGLIHSYTLECNYNTGRTVNCVAQASHDNGRATPPPPAGFPPKYTPEIFEEVGRALGVAALDMLQANPWSRILHSEFASYENLRLWMLRYVRSSRGNPILPRKMGRISTRVAANTSGVGNGGNGTTSNNNNNNNNNGNNSLRTGRSNTDVTKPIVASSGYGRQTNRNTIQSTNRLVPVKTSSSTTLSVRAVVQNGPTRSDVMRRQKNLIRAAVNGSTKNSLSSLSVSQMHSFHAHDDLTHDNSREESHVTLSFTNAGVHQKSHGLYQTSRSNPEPGFSNSPSSIFGPGSNSDSELFRGSLTETPISREINFSPMLPDFYGLTEEPHEAKLPPPPKSIIWNKSKAPSRAPRGKDIISPHISKPPSVHRGRSPHNTQPPLIGVPSTHKVVVGPGGVVTIPTTPSKPRYYTQDNQSLFTNSIYLNNPPSMSVQPLSVSQKPIFLPVERCRLTPTKRGLSC